MSVVVLVIDRADDRQHVFKCSREPVLRMQGGGELVAECVGTLEIGGLSAGSYPVFRPYTVETFRIMSVRVEGR